MQPVLNHKFDISHLPSDFYAKPARPLVRAIAMLWMLGQFGLANSDNTAAPAATTAQVITLEQAVKRVTRESGGKILSARRIQTRQGPVFRIKVLTRTGRVRVVQIAESEASTSKTNVTKGE
jgi:hypothetical protein